MKILLTGASGLIGREIIKHAVIEKHEVVGVSRDVSAAKKRLKKYYGPQVAAKAEWTSNLDSFKDLNEFDAVINLAGEPIVNKRWTDEQKRLLENSRWLITKRLADLINASDIPPRVFISGSAVGYYGRQGDAAISEDYEHIHDEFSHRLCKKWETLALSASAHSRVCLLRTGIVLSNKGGALDKMLLPFKFGLGGPIGDGSHYMPWIHLEDMARAVLFLIKTVDCQGAFNLTAPTPVTNKEFSKTLAGVISRPAFLPMPEKILQVLMGEMADLLITGQNAIPTKLSEAGFSFMYPQLKDALQDLNL
ncbi:TIGR01777 family oxidoreductase [Planctobacterium marinum]|uniref:TIGR01777 family oxidoreductase n=1 Tax=Planctobacterium marinum TaxID=1631968 RepID=UPI001E3F3150|nr:TIGR01777 family oxidoreductase [Planctobacterium marinum]MCC2607244.1 TIGR01777 family oxidoreductase [Planctobacterium marinum]